MSLEEKLGRLTKRAMTISGDVIGEVECFLYLESFVQGLCNGF